MQKISLLEKYPEIAKEWHPIKNGKLIPNEVTAGASKKAWWKCKKGHDFEQQIRYHVMSQRCPICSGKKVSTETSLAILFPELACEWHPTKNGSLKPTDVRPGSGKRVWWQCPKFTHHIYSTTVHQRTKNKSQCAKCQGRAIAYESSIMSLYPELIKEWDFDKNLDSPDILSIGSSKKVWWICKSNSQHNFESRINERVQGKKCPICFPPSHEPNVLPTLNIANPTLLKEWDYKKNASFDPNKITAGSNKKVWWICSKCNHSWESTILNRFRGGRGCPKCAKLIPSHQNILAVKFPEIAKEWDYEKNQNLTPNDVSYGSGKKVGWICQKDNSHRWVAMIRDRTRANPNTCPHCRNRKSILANDYPEIAKEWHPIKNGDLTPFDVAAKSNNKVWWVCKINPSHEWEAEIKNRTILKSGCWHCYKEGADISTTRNIIDSIISNSAYYKNYKLGIENIIKLSEIKIWNQPLKLTYRRMIFANIITLLEAYLADSFIKTVLDDPVLIRKYVESTPRFQEEKITISNIYLWLETAEKKIEEDLLNITYHNIWKVQKMYNSVLNVTFSNNLDEVQKIINIRHDLIHRAGKTKEGKTININNRNIKKAIDNINMLVQHIEKQHSEKFPNL